MDSASPQRNRYYRPELDVLRFLAFALVFLSHSLPNASHPQLTRLLGGLVPLYDSAVTATGFGLNLFFALSAFLICELLLRERDAAATVQVKQFYLRRMLRIWPLYYLGLCLGGVVALLPAGHKADLVALGWYGIFLSTWFIPAHRFLASPAGPLWSISVEEQFYAVVPWLTKYLNRKVLYAFCIVVILVANGWLFHLGRVRAPIYRIWGSSFVQFEPFAAGILLCLILHGRLPKIGIWQRLILLAAGWSAWVFACYRFHPLFDPDKNPGGAALMCGYALAAMGSVMLLVAFLGADSKSLPKWAIYLGRISFGLYVYHEFAIYLTSNLARHLDAVVIQSYLLRALRVIGIELLLPMALTVLMAMLSYHLFETPFLKMKRRHTLIESSPLRTHTHSTHFRRFSASHPATG